MRTTGVKLIAETGQYKREMAASAKATRVLKDDITGVGTSMVATSNRIGSAAARSAADFDEMTRHASTLDRQIRNTEAAIRSLAKGFANTGDPNLLREIAAQKRVLNELRNVRSLLPQPGELAGAGVQMGTKISAGFASSLRAGLPAAVNPAMVAAGVGAAPVFISAFSSVLSAGAGAALLGVGLTAAAKDPVVQLRGAEVGRRFTTSLQREAREAFRGPLLQVLDQMDAAGQRVTARLGLAFDQLAPHLDPFTAKVLAAGEAVTGSLAGAAEKSGPALDGLGDSVALLGNATSYFITTVSNGGPEAANHLRLIAGATADVVKHTADVLNMANKLASNAWITGPLLPLLRKHYSEAAAEAAQLAVQQKKLPPQLDLTARAALGQRDALTALSTELRAQTDPAFALLVAQDRLRKAHADVAEAVKKHGRNSVQARGATRELAGAALDLQSRVGALGSSFTGNLSPAMLATYRAAGLTEKQIADVAKQFRAAKTSADRYVGDYRARASAPGAVQAKKDLDRAYTAANGFAGPYRADLVVTGKKRVDAEFNDLLVKQRALQGGLTIPAARAALQKDADRNRQRAYAEGGWTGPGHKHQPAGIVHADEFVVQKSARRQLEARHPGLLQEMNATGQLPVGYADGGRVGRWPFLVSASNAWIPSLAEALSKVTPQFGDWPSGPGSQRGDSGVWRRIVGLIKASGINQGSFGNSYRPGDPKWHGSGRAVDWMGYNMDALATFLAGKRPLELIHRTRSRDYAYTRGRNMGSFNNALMEAHRNHIHIAMANGGIIREPVIGVGASGRSYSFAERGPERVLSAGQTTASMGGDTTIHLSISVAAGVHPAEVGRQTVEHIGAYLKTGGSLWVKGRQVLP